MKHEKVIANADKYCRICFRHSPNKKDQMLPLDSFLPLIRLIAQTEVVLQKDQSNICQSCANVLVMANLFRVKVIESNAVFRELLNKEAEPDNIKLELENFTSQPYIVNEQIEHDEYMDYECLDEDLEDIPVIKATTVKKNGELNQKPKKVLQVINQQKSVAMITARKECSVCGEKEVKELPSSTNLMILKKILLLSDNEKIHVCSKCLENLRRVEVFFERNFTVNSVENECKCQFCLKSKVQLGTMAKYLFIMYNSLPDTIKKVPENAKVEKKTCNECIKVLQVVHKVQRAFKIKERTKRRIICREELLRDFGLVSNVTPEKRKSTSSRKLKRRFNQRYVKPDSDEEVSDGYQCHMSDFDEVESDTDMPIVKFGSPLNTPFTFKYLECTECHTKCISSLQLEVHIEIMHRTLSTICNLCNKKFPHTDNVKNHKNNVHFAHCSYSINGRNNNKSLCDVCGLLTREFNYHYDIHIGVKNYVCHFCGHTARCKDKLKCHILAIHTKIKKYLCKYCGKGFSYSPDRMRHEIGSHTKQYKHICKLCNRGFLKKNFLTAHQKTHDVILITKIK